MTDVQDTLAERAKTYGDFRDIARISGDLQRTMHGTRNWAALPDTAREALQTIASKIARILNGDPEHIDSWHDIAGYATLEADRLRKDAANDVARPAIRREVSPIDDTPAESLINDMCAVPPAGYECEFSPIRKKGEPWRARKKGEPWVRAATWREALKLAGSPDHV